MIGHKKNLHTGVGELEIGTYVLPFFNSPRFSFISQLSADFDCVPTQKVRRLHSLTADQLNLGQFEVHPLRTPRSDPFSGQLRAPYPARHCRLPSAANTFSLSPESVVSAIGHGFGRESGSRFHVRTCSSRSPPSAYPAYGRSSSAQSSCGRGVISSSLTSVCQKFRTGLCQTVEKFAFGLLHRPWSHR